MRTKVTLVLVFLNVALFFFIFKFERAWRTDAQMLEVRRRVLGPEAADIHSLTITSATPGSSFSLERRGEAWWLTKPIEWPANPRAVSGITQALTLLEHETSFAVKDLAQNGTSLASYGLDKPRLSVGFSSGSSGAGPSSTLKIGDAANDRLYVLSPDGERIHVVNRSFIDTITLTLDQLRADALFTIQVFEAQSLSVRLGASGNVPVRIRRDGARWIFDSPFSGRGNKTDIEVAINGLNGLHAKTFDPASPPSARPADAPTLQVTVDGNKRSETLYLGAPVPLAPGTAPGAETEYYAQIKGSEQTGNPRATLFTVALPNDLLQKLQSAPVKLRERRMLDFDPRNVTSITLSSPLQPNQPTLTLQRLDPTSSAADGSDWQLIRRGDSTQGAQTLPADRPAVQRLLEQLRNLSARTVNGFVSDAPSGSQLEGWGFNRPEREITLTLSEPDTARNAGAPTGAKNTTQSLQLAVDADHNHFARVDGKGSVYAVDAEPDREFQVTPLAWRSRQLAPPPAATIVALTIAPTADGAAPIYTHVLTAGETWDAALAAESAPRKKAIEDVLTQLRGLRARSFLQDKFTDKIFVAGEDRPWKYRLDATISLPGGSGQTSTLTLFLSDRVGGAEQYAGSKELDVVFAIDQSFLDALFPLLYAKDPGPPHVESAKPEPPATK